MSTAKISHRKVPKIGTNGMALYIVNLSAFMIFKLVINRHLYTVILVEKVKSQFMT